MGIGDRIRAALVHCKLHGVYLNPQTQAKWEAAAEMWLDTPEHRKKVEGFEAAVHYRIKFSNINQHWKGTEQ